MITFRPTFLWYNVSDKKINFYVIIYNFVFMFEGKGKYFNEYKNGHIYIYHKIFANGQLFLL